ncbi:hypothetical protein WICMUC_002183 [Wickerhamomyces mucosus]|uniref:Uncharacterized protein n=1 Tax=Wickerhamomyces mucosus TaxID=1378264 RepID=A0A9P8TF79_9ASCO|nr:hypothetical protein WICMUC_002183 [Wickerhamomyces mucosus]
MLCKVLKKFFIRGLFVNARTALETLYGAQGVVFDIKSGNAAIDPKILEVKTIFLVGFFNKYGFRILISSIGPIVFTFKNLKYSSGEESRTLVFAVFNAAFEINTSIPTFNLLSSVESLIKLSLSLKSKFKTVKLGSFVIDSSVVISSVLRTVAMTLSPLDSNCLTNSNPMPLLVPVMK